MKKIFIFITGLLLGISVAVSATILYSAKDIEYKDTNVEEAINDLYDKVDSIHKLTPFILQNGASVKMDNNNDYYLNFDGVDDYVQIGTIPASVNWSDGFSLEFKAEWNALNIWSRIFDFGNGSLSDNLVIANYRESDSMILHLVNNNTENAYIPSTSMITLNRVNNYKINYKKSNNGFVIEYFKDDELINTVNSNFTVRNVNRVSNYIGKSNWSGDGYFKGKIYYLKITQADGTDIINIDINKLYK